jgi:endonuclease/exonuclease/phosphatase family metal-dependent hydrolase
MQNSLSILLCFLAMYLGVWLPTTAQIDSLTVLSWNVKMLPTFMEARSKTQRAKAIVAQLKDSQADIVVLQELFYKKTRKLITKELQAIYPYQTTVLNPRAVSLKSNGGVLIMSKHPFIQTAQHIRFSARKGIDRMARKGAMWVEIAYKGKKVQVVGTHLQAWGTDSILYRQYRQIYEELLRPNEQKNVPQLICGDFNTLKKLPDSLPPTITPARVATMPRYAQLLTTLQATDGDLLGKHQFTMDRPHNDMCKKFKQSRIVLDYIFIRNHSPHICIERSVKVLRQQWHKAHQDLSDHYAVEGKLYWYAVP